MSDSRPFRVIIAGTRTFDQYDLLVRKMDFYLRNHSSVEIVSGGQRGADKLGERYAKERGYGLKIFEANFKLYGKPGGPIRNGEMARYSDAAVVFWNGVSSGSRDMLKQSKENDLLTRTVYYEEPNR